MIEPFEAAQVRDGTISYGVSSYGYDIRVAPEFKVFTNVHNVVVDPKVFDDRSFVDVNEDECIIPPNSFALARTLEYFRIPRDTLVLCVGKSTYARCFRGDTRVALVDGTAPTLEEMALRSEDGEMFWGYSLDRYGRIVVALLDAPRHVGRDALLELTLDNGEAIRCTPDHEFIRRNGRLEQAHELRPGDSMMPLYRDLARGDEVVYQPLNGHLHPTHRLANEWNLRNGLYDDEGAPHRHHRDHDRRNNNPWNIERTEAHRERALNAGNGARYTAARERLRSNHAATWKGPRDAAPRTMRHLQRDGANRRSPSHSSGRTWQGTARVRGRPPARNHEVEAIRELPGQHDVYCLTVPEAGNFALASGIFTLNCGIIVNVTPLEPTWRGHLTLEISNTTPLPAKIYANEGIAQLIFFQSDEEPETAYEDRKGKYQDQEGVTLPKL